MSKLGLDMYAVILRRDRTKIAAAEEAAWAKESGLAAPFFGNSLEDAKKEVMLTYASRVDDGMNVDAWLEKMGWDVVPMNPELDAQYDSLFAFDEDEL